MRNVQTVDGTDNTVSLQCISVPWQLTMGYVTVALAEKRALSADRYCLAEKMGGCREFNMCRISTVHTHALTCPLTHSFRGKTIRCLAMSYRRKIFFCGFKVFAHLPLFALSLRPTTLLRNACSRL